MGCFGLKKGLDLENRVAQLYQEFTDPRDLYCVGYDRIPHLHRLDHFHDTLWNTYSDMIPVYSHIRLFGGNHEYLSCTRHSRNTTVRLLGNLFYSCRCTSRLYFCTLL